MIRKDLYRIKSGIEACAELKNEASLEFAHTLAIIYDEIMKEVDLIEKAKKQSSPTFLEYQEKFKLIQLAYAIKKEDGSILMHNDNIMLKEPIEYEAKIKELKEEYKTAIADQEKIVKEFDDFLSKSIDTPFTKIPISLFPTDINVWTILMLNPVITK